MRVIGIDQSSASTGIFSTFTGRGETIKGEGLSAPARLDRIETGIIPYIAWDSESLAKLLEDLAGDLQEALAAYRRLTEAACEEIEAKSKVGKEAA